MEIEGLNSDEEKLVDYNEKLIKIKQAAIETTSTIVNMLKRTSGVSEKKV